jgi:hypothetical protein
LFSTLSVLLAVGDLLPPHSRTRAIEFIVANRRVDGTWTFDPEMPIPPDSDDTACALAVLARYAPRAAGAGSADLLRSFWREDNGPFATWRDVPQQWQQTDRDDAVVNCNVLLALHALGEPPTAIEIQAVIGLINRSTKGTRYYCSPITIGYSARRAAVPLASIQPRLLARPRLDKGVLPTAQWLSAVRKWDLGAVAHVLATQSAEGSWDAENWCRDVRSGRWGSAAVSTALCIEGLHAAASAAQTEPPRRIFPALRLFSRQGWSREPRQP